MSTKKKDCPHCNGKGRKYIYRNGTVIDSYFCLQCDGTGKVNKKKDD